MRSVAPEVASDVAEDGEVIGNAADFDAVVQCEASNCGSRSRLHGCGGVVQREASGIGGRAGEGAVVVAVGEACNGEGVACIEVRRAAGDCSAINRRGSDGRGNRGQGEGIGIERIRSGVDSDLQDRGVCRNDERDASPNAHRVDVGERSYRMRDDRKIIRKQKGSDNDLCVRIGDRPCALRLRKLAGVGRRDRSRIARGVDCAVDIGVSSESQRDLGSVENVDDERCRAIAGIGLPEVESGVLSDGPRQRR